MAKTHRGIAAALFVFIGALASKSSALQFTEDEAIGAWDEQSGELLWVHRTEALSGVTLELYPDLLIARAAETVVYVDPGNGESKDPPATLEAPLAQSATEAAFVWPIVRDGTVYGLLDGPSNSPAGPPKPPSPDDPNKKHDDDCGCRVPGANHSPVSASGWFALLALAARFLRRSHRL